MHSFFLLLFEFFKNRKWLFLIVLTTTIGLSIWSVTSIEVETDINSALPKSSEFKKYSSVAKDNINLEVLFGVEAQGYNSYKTRQRLDSIQELLTETLDGFIFDIEYDFSNREIDYSEFFLDNIYYFLEDDDYKKIEPSLSKDSVHERINFVSSQLKSINSIYTRSFLIKDPLSIGLPKLLDNWNTKSAAITTNEGLLINETEGLVLIRGTLVEGLNYDEKRNLQHLLESIKTELANSNIDFDFFSSFLYENENAQVIKKDTRLTLGILTILLVILLFYFYRNIKITLFFVSAVTLSFICGLAITSLFVDSISGLAIAASSVLLGIVVDYSFHVITHYSKSRDLEETIKTITKPLLIGSFTTVFAFAALMYTESSILNDFGLIALCTLSTSAFINLTVLPLLLKFLKLDISFNELGQNIKAPRVIKTAATSMSFGSIIFFFIIPPQPLFDMDIKNLGYFPENLIQAEQRISGINPNLHKSVLIFIEDESLGGALNKTGILREHLHEFHKEAIIQINDPEKFIIYPEKSKHKADQWNQFWRDKSQDLENNITLAAKNNGLHSNVFQSFVNNTKEVIIVDSISLDLARDIGVERLITKTEEGYRVATTMIINKDSIEVISSKLPEIDGIYLFDSSELATSVLDTVTKDFNKLLLFTSLLVFISLAILYGRLELALFSFFPMAVIWIWVLYISSALNINFNFVNVMLATIIFGLGDDYSIFVTDGLLKKYKGNHDVGKTYNTAIILSALTTTFGTGVLFFANHPSLNSISAMSVIGMASIVIVTMIVQPHIFDWFIIKRIKKGLTPITLAGLIITILDFMTFIFGCLFIWVLAGVFIVIPISLKAKRKAVNLFVSRLARFILRISVYIKKEKFGFEKFDFSRPSIIISNHVSFVDIILALSLNEKVVLVAKEWVSRTPIMGFVIKYSGHICVEYGEDKMMEEIKDRVTNGYSIFFFPEGTRSPDGELKRFHKGAFHISKELKLDIQPVIFTGCEHVSPKGDFIIKRGKMNVHVLDRISYDDPIMDNRLGIVCKDFKSLMSDKLHECRKIDYDMSYMGKRIFYNYIYKGTVLERYFKVKWRIESKNYKLCNELIGDRKRIYDLGTGYGYFSFFMHYFDESREITAVDFDKEKIDIAANSAFKNDNLEFVHGKVEDVTFEDFDACVLYDVLHYIRAEKRIELFSSLIEKLNPEGIIIIRDGISNYTDSHSKTRFTEFISTKMIRFNKLESDLDYMSLEEIENLCTKFNLKSEIIQDSKSMSNIIITLKKAS